MGMVFALLFLVFFSDQISKWLVLERLFLDRLQGVQGLSFFDWLAAQKLEPMPPISIEYTSFFNLSMAWNRGISFSMFYSTAEHMPYILAGFALAVALGFLLWATRRDVGRMERLGIGLIVGGALGNAFDRLRFGAVADFFDFHYAGWHFPAFNIADSAITLGVLFILLYGFTQRTKR